MKAERGLGELQLWVRVEVAHTSLRNGGRDGVIGWDGVRLWVGWDGVRLWVGWDGVRVWVGWDGVRVWVGWDGVRLWVGWDGVRLWVGWDEECAWMMPVLEKHSVICPSAFTCSSFVVRNLTKTGREATCTITHLP